MRQIVRASGLAGALLACAVAFRAHAQTGSYTQINIASDIVGMAESVAPQMINPWGLTHTNGTRQGSGWYIAYAGAGVLDEITAEGDVSPYFITIPAASGQGDGTPAGACVFGGITTFTTLDGTVQQPLSSDIATIVDKQRRRKGRPTPRARSGARRGNWARHAVRGEQRRGASRHTTSGFNPVTLAPGAFTDPTIPSGFTHHTACTRPGLAGRRAGTSGCRSSTGRRGRAMGYVDAFDQNGNLLRAPAAGELVEPALRDYASARVRVRAVQLRDPRGHDRERDDRRVQPESSGAFTGFLKDSSGQYHG
jgi:hypothetical protein